MIRLGQATNAIIAHKTRLARRVRGCAVVSRTPSGAFRVAKLQKATWDSCHRTLERKVEGDANGGLSVLVCTQG